MTRPDIVWFAPAENDHRGLEQLPLRPVPSVTVVVPVYNRVLELERTLAGLVAQDHDGEMTVVVADDGSDEDVAEVAAAFEAKLDVTLVRREHDGYGAGQARNLGAAHAADEVLVFVDADCIPAPDLVRRHLGWHRRADNVVVIGSRLHIDERGIEPGEIEAGTASLAARTVDRHGGDGDSGAPDDFRRRFYRRTAGLRLGDEAFRALVSSNFSVRRDRFLDAGGFSEDFTRWGGEDTELGWRLFNAGLVFVPDNAAVVHHQAHADEGAGTGWRSAARRRNAGLIASKIPHRFYREPRRGFIYEVPKVSWVVTPVAGIRIEELWDQLLRQSHTDFELVVPTHAADETLERFFELAAGDPRVTAARGATEGEAFAAAITAARGEYLAILHGWAAVDHRLLGRAVRRLDRRPRAGIVRCGYQIRTPDGPVRHLHQPDVVAVDAAWNTDAPVFALTRTRDWAMLRRGTSEPHTWWRSLEQAVRKEWLPDALVALPSAAKGDRPPERVPAVTGDRTLLYEDVLRGGPRDAAAALARFATSRIRRRPYRAGGVAWETAPPPQPTADRPKVSYVGWVGKENMGDEAMLEGVRALMPWADIAPDIEHPSALMLGGGTLINRRLYLDWLQRRDSPRRERVTFGTGVADPVFWGGAEAPDDWVDFLETCGFVGLRGPRSLETLREWGYRGEAAVVGDVALAVAPPADVDRVPGRIVVSPAWTAGELWGGDDRAVFDAMAAVVRRARAEDRDVSFLSCFPGDDRHIFEMMRAAGQPEAAYVAGYDDVAAALRLLASADLVVAERLHAAVLAAGCGTPFVAVEYRPKVRDFAASLGLERLVIRSDAVSADALGALMHEVAGEAVAAEITASVRELRTRLEAAAEAVRSLLTV